MQAARRTFLRRTKATSPPDTTEADAAIDNEKFSKRGSSRFKSKESAGNETSTTRRPSLNAARRGERPPTRTFVRRRFGVNVTTTSTAAPASTSASAVTRRPFRIANRRRPNITTTTTTTTTTTQATTLAVDSEESLQDIGDIDAIEDPSLEPKAPKKTTKTPRRPLVNLKEELKDQNPSATNEEESKRQSKKYSASFKQNELGDLLRAKDQGETTTTSASTVEEYNAETALALATHQLITAPLPSFTDYDEGTKPTRSKTTYKGTTDYTNTPTYEPYNTATYKINPTAQDFVQSTVGEAYSIYDTPRITTVYDEKTTADFTASSLGPTYTATYEPRTYSLPKTTEDISTTDSRLSTQNIDPGKVTAFITDTFPTTVGRQTGYTNFPAPFEPRISTTFEIPRQTETIRYSTTPVYQPSTNQYGPTTRDYTEPPERSSSTLYYSTPEPSIAKSPRGFSAPNVITPGYSGVQRGGARYQTTSQKYVTTTEDVGYSTSGYKSSSQEPAYFTREYLLESPVTKTYDEEYQYLSPTTPQTTTQARKVFRKKIQRRISTTLPPTTSTTTAYVPETTTPRPARVPSRKPFEKVAKVEPNRTYRPVVNYDYYDDSAEKVALKYAEGTKVILHGKGSIECLDVGNFPHPSSCKKFISCARMEFGSLLGWEYVCPKGLSFDPVGGICNWSAGLGCDEKD